MPLGDIIAIAQAAREIITIVDQTFAFSGECQELKQKCEVVKKILEGSETVEDYPELKNAVERALAYLQECRKRRFVRNPFFEVVFHPRIEKYTRTIESWITIIILSVDIHIQTELKKNTELSKEVHDDSKEVLATSRRLEEKLDFVVTAERLERLGAEENKYSNLKIRSELWNRVPVITPNEVSISEQPDGHAEFVGSLVTGEAIRFVPLEKDKYDTPRLLVVYGEISRSVGVQRLYGIFKGRYGHYAVMEDVKVDSILKDVLLGTDSKITEPTPLNRLKICLDLATCVAYLHSVHIIVKVLSDSSIYLQSVNGNLIPILANLQHARLV